jgi:hypothetical protein
MHEAQHDPQLAERLALERRLGGHTRSIPVELPKPDFGSEDGIRTTLEKAAAAVLAGQLAPTVLNALSQAAGVAIRLAEFRLDQEELRLTQDAAQAKTRREIVLDEGTRA